MTGARVRLSAVAAVAIAIAAMAAARRLPAFHALPLIAPDSASYLHFDVGRTPAYPLFLRALPLGIVPAVQLVCLAAASAWLAYELAVSVHPAVGIAVELIVLANSAYMAYAFTILPEALFATTEQVLVALLLRLQRRASTGAGISAGIAVLLLCLLKPAGYSFLAAVAAIFWMTHVPLRKVAVSAAAVVGGGLLVASGLNYARTGIFATQAYGGYAMVGYVGQLIDRDTPSEDPELVSEISARTATSREELTRIHDIDLYYMASSSAYHDLLETIRRSIDQFVARRESGLDEQARFVKMNQIAGALAAAVVREHPRGYVEHAAAHWYGLWFMPLVRNRADHGRFEAALAHVAAVAPYTMRSPIAYREMPPLVFWPFKLFLVWVFVASLAGILAAAVRVGRPAAVATATAAVMLHANFALVAAVQTGLPRYALALWPATAVAGVAGVWWVVESLWVRRLATGTTRRTAPSAG